MSLSPRTSRPGALRRGVVMVTSTLLLVPTALVVSGSPALAHPITVPSVPGGPVVIDGNDPGDHIADVTAYIQDVYTNLDTHVVGGYVNNGRVAVIGTCRSYLVTAGTGQTFDGFTTAAAVQGLFADIGANNYKHLHICSTADAPSSLPIAVQTELAQAGSAIAAHVNRGGGLFSTGHDYAWLRDLFPSITVTAGGTSSSYVTTDGHAFFPNLPVDTMLDAVNHWTFSGNETTPLKNLLTSSPGGAGLKVAIGGITVRFPQLLLEGPATAAVGSTQPYEFTAATADGTLLSSTAFTYSTTSTAGVVTNGAGVTDANGQYAFTDSSVTRGDTRLRVQMNLGGTASGASMTTTWLSLAAQPVLTAANVVGQAGQTALSWPAPSSPYAAITDYVIETSVDGTSWSTVTDGVSATTGYTVTGLDVTQAHQFRVSAVTMDGAGPVSAVATVVPQTITFAAPPDAVVSDGTLALTASATSSLPVAFSSSTPATCTVSGATLTYLGIGTCTVTAAQGGSAAYQVAPVVTHGFVLTSPVPAPTGQTTTGTGPAAQTTTVTPPVGGQVKLLDGSTPVDTLVVAGVGTYTVVPSTGVITFTPETAFQGQAAAVTYRVSDRFGQSSTATFTATVVATPLTAPAPPASASRGAQTTTITVPPGGSVTLLEGGAAVGSLVVAGQGSYVLDPSSGVITFTPQAGFTGYPTPVSVRVSDVYGQTGTGTYAPLVLPDAPVAGEPTTTGIGTARQATTVTVPPGGTVALLDAGGTPATTVTVPGQGTYALDVDSGALTFTPLNGFAGAPTPATFRVTDAYAQTTLGTYAPVVTPPAAPVPTTDPTAEVGTATPSARVALPSGGGITLLGPSGEPVSTLVVTGQGTYVLDTVTGTIVFVAAPGFSGRPTAVTYRVTDAYGQVGTGTYGPVVTAPAPPVTPAPSTPATGTPATGTPAKAKPSVRTPARVIVPSTGKVPVRCQLDKGRLQSCAVTIYATVNGRQVLVGSGVVTVAAGTRVGGVTVQVRLTAAGRALAAQPGGVTLTTVATLVQRGVVTPLTARSSTTIVSRSVPVARPVYFDSDEASIRPAELRYLRSLKRQLNGVKTVRCIGHTDSRQVDDYNVDLGRQRAKAVCAYLTKGTTMRGTVVTTGENQAASSNATSRGRQLNRRTDIVLGY